MILMSLTHFHNKALYSLFANSPSGVYATGILVSLSLIYSKRDYNWFNYVLHNLKHAFFSNFNYSLVRNFRNGNIKYLIEKYELLLDFIDSNQWWKNWITKIAIQKLKFKVITAPRLWKKFYQCLRYSWIDFYLIFIDNTRTQIYITSPFAE